MHPHIYSSLWCSIHKLGRLDLPEIGALDEAGCVWILKVHTKKLLDNSLLELDVSLEDIGKNYFIFLL